MKRLNQQGIITEGGRISTIDLLVLTSSDRLLFMIKKYFSFFDRTSYLNKEANSTEPFSKCSLL